MRTNRSGGTGAVLAVLTAVLLFMGGCDSVECQGSDCPALQSDLVGYDSDRGDIADDCGSYQAPCCQHNGPASVPTCSGSINGAPLVCHPAGVCMPCGTWGGPCCYASDGTAFCGEGKYCMSNGICNFAWR